MIMFLVWTHNIKWYKAKFKKMSSKMTKHILNQKNINTNVIKTNKDIEMSMDSNIDPIKCDDNLLHNKIKKKNAI